MKSSKVFLIALGTFFFSSGVSSLMLQTAWNRILAQVIGIDFASQIVVVSIFMLGLGTGSLLGGWITKRFDKPIYFLIIAEIIISVYGIFSSKLLRVVQNFIASAFEINLQIPYIYVDFLFYFSALILPVILMGTSLPIVVHVAKARFSIGETTGFYYSVNVFGAAVGALLSGVLLLGYVGIQGVLNLSALFNLIITLAFLLFMQLTRKFDIDSDTSVECRSISRLSSTNLLPLALMFGFLSLGFQTWFLRILTFYFGTKSYVFPLIVASSLLHLMIGNYLSAKLLQRRKKTDWILKKALILTMIASTAPLLSAYIIKLFLPKYGVASFLIGEKTKIEDLALIAIFIFLLLICLTPISMAFPAIVSSCESRSDEVGANVAKIYLFTTLGNFFATVVIGALIIPNFGVVYTYAFLLLTTAILYISMLSRNEQSKFRAINGRNLVCALGVFCAVYLSSNLYQTVTYKNQPPVRVSDEFNGTVLAHPTLDEAGKLNGFRLNSGAEPATSFNIYNKSWALENSRLAPTLVALDKEPQRILIIGIGTGDFLVELNRAFPRAEIVVIELYESVILEMQNYGAPEIRDALDKANVIIMDGSRFVNKLIQSHAKRKFDLVEVGISHVTSAGAGNLFTREFFQKLSTILSPNGVITSNAYAPLIKHLTIDKKRFFIYSYGNDKVSDLYFTNNIEDESSLRDRFQQSYQILYEQHGEKLCLSNGKNGDVLQHFVILDRQKVSSHLKEIEPLTYDRLVTDHFVFQNISTPGAIDPRIWKDDKVDLSGHELSQFAKAVCKLNSK